jgi:hypothetical protein
MSAQRRPDTAILQAAAALLAVVTACGILAPAAFWLALAATVAAALLGLVLRHPTGFCVAWLLIAGMSLEMTMNDLIGGEAYQPTIAAVKAAQIVLAGLCALRFGLRFDPCNPALAYLVIMGIGLAHGLHPALTMGDSVRSLIGSAAPFAFCFCRLPPAWPDAIVRATKWAPLVAVAVCLPLSALGIRPLFIDSGGARLAALGHPAFLAGVCLPAIYACLVQLYRQGRTGDVWLLVANFLVLALTGARAPMAYAVFVTGISLLTIRSRVFPVGTRLLLVLAAGCTVPFLVIAAANLEHIRLFNVVTHQAVDLSGRDILWPEFLAAAGQSPWFGWGIGAGNVVIPPDGRIVKILHTLAAHNEYLRMQVEGGQVGRTLLVLSFAAWVMLRSRPLPTADRRIIRLVFLAFAAHAATDNVLISTPACVLFAFATAVFAGTRADSSG